VRIFKKLEAFLKHLKKIEVFFSNVKHFEGIFREVEASDYKNKAFIKINRLFEDIF
jgi:hypothetical protein